MLSLRHRILAWFLALALAAPPLSAVGPGALGCSILPEGWGTAVQQGLDQIFLGACTAHDLCYRRCNVPGGPYVGYADEEDHWGIVLRWWSPIYFDDGSTSMSVDIFFERFVD